MPLTRWKKGDPFSASHLNEVIDLTSACMPISADGEGQSVQGKNGTAITIPKRPSSRLAIVMVSSTISGKTGLYNAKHMIDLPTLIDLASIDPNDLVNKFLKDPGTEDCVVWNPAEYNAAPGTHSVIPPTPFVAYLSQKMTTETPPARSIYFLLGLPFSMPAPTARYQVYTPIDDTLIPVWTTLRFES